MAAPEPDPSNDPQLDGYIAEMEAILPLIRLSKPLLALIAGQLASLLRDRASRDDDDASVDRSLAVTEHALGLLDPDDPARRSVLAERALTLHMRFDRLGRAADLEAEIAIWRELADPAKPESDVSVAEASAQLGLALWRRFERLVADDAADSQVETALDEAHRVLHVASTMEHVDSSMRAMLRWLLGLSWAKRYDRDGDPLQLDHAITEVEAAVRAVDEPLGATQYAVLASLRHERAATGWVAADHEITEQVRGDLAAARDWIRAGLDAIDPDDPERADLLWSAAAIAATCFDSSIEGVDLTELRSWTKQLVAYVDAIDAQQTSDDAKAAHLIHGRVLAEIAMRSDSASVPPEMASDLDDEMRYVARLLEGVDSHLAFDPAAGPRLTMMVRPDRTPAIAAQMVQRWRGLPPGPERGTVAGALATMLLALHQAGWIEPDLAETTAMATEALAVHPDDETWQSKMRLVLATLQAMGAVSTDPALAHEAIDTLNKIRSTDPDVQRDVLGVLSNALLVRGVATREIADLEAALSATEKLLAETSPQDEQYPSLEIQAGTLRMYLGIARNDEAMIRQGMELLRHCADSLPRNDTRLVAALSNLATGEAWLAGQGTASSAVGRVAALIEAAEGVPGMRSDVRVQLDLARSLGPVVTRDVGAAMAMVDMLRAQAHEADDSYLGLRRRLAAGAGLAFRAMLVRDAADADTAVQELEQAQSQLAGDVRHPLWSEVAMVLGRAYRARADLTEPGPNQAADRDRSRRQGLLALRGHAWRVLAQSNTDNAMAAAREAAENAIAVAGWCVADRVPADAAVALDAGRGLILHTASVTPGLGQAPTDPTAVAADPRSRRLLAIVEEAESVGARLLDPPLVADVRRALRRLGAHALVYLVPRSSGIAPVAVFVPAQGDPTIVDLPIVGVAPDRFVEALARTDIRHRDVDTSDAPPAPRLREALPTVTAWAWEAAMARVLDHCHRSGFTRPYRLVLVPMGQLGIVPWHAARSPSGRYALQDAVISYTASARLLCDVAGRARIPPDRGGLVVGNPTGDLVHAGVEATAIRDRFYPDGRYLGAGDTPSPATPEAVLSWLAGTVADPCGVMHLACHGVVEVGAANSSRLILAGDSILSAERLVESPDWPPGACQLGLVCLAACSTGVAARGYDEAFSLATAFQVAGARSVVSSLWRVPDEATSLLMYMLHHYLVEDRLGPAEALRLAQLWMLDPDRREPAGMPSALRSRLARLDVEDVSAWAGFVHYGQW